MNANDEKVDVLAVMERAITWDEDQENAMRSARYAVSNLIDAVEHWCALMPGLAGGHEFDRMRKAVKRVRGKA